jgi:hypothetical protein
MDKTDIADAANLPVLPDALAEPLLRDFFASNIYDPMIPPRRCDPALVARVTLAEAGPSADPSRHSHALTLCGAYALRETAGAYAGMLGLDTLEPGSQGLLVTLAALVGDDDARDRAQAHFETVMLADPDARQRIPLLLTCLVALGPDAAPGPLPGLVSGWWTEAQARAGASDAAYIASQELARIANDELPTALDAIALRADIEAAPAQEQVWRMIRLYAQLDIAHAAALHRWCAFRLIAIATRGPEARAALADLFRAALPEAEALAPETAAFIRARLLWGVAHCAPGSITPEDAAALAAAEAEGQDEIISTAQPPGAPRIEPF